MSFLPKSLPRAAARSFLPPARAPRAVAAAVRPDRAAAAPPATHMILDPMHPGLPIAALTHPADWPTQSLAVWNFRDQNNLALIFARTMSPDGALAVEFLPHENFYWLAWSLGFAGGAGYTTSIGGKSYGATSKAPMSAMDALTRIVIPKHRGDRQGLAILSTAACPGLAEALGQTHLRGIQHEGVSARIAYNQNGMAFEEEIFACCYWHPASGGQQNWGITPIVAIRAPAGRLDATRRMLWQIAASVQVNPQWVATCAGIAQSLHSQQAAALYQAQHDARMQEAQQSRRMQDYLAWSRDTQQATIDDRWRSDQRRNDQFGDAMMGRTPYQDPASTSGVPHYDHGHHRHVWTDGQGQFQHSNDPNFDPNAGSDRTWRVAVPA